MSALVLVAGLAATASTPAGAQAAPAWTRVRFDTANTGFNPSETSLSPANVASVAEDWRAGSTPGASPVVAGSVVYTGCQLVSMCAYDATNGALRWKTDVGTREPPRWSVLVGDVLYLGGGYPITEYALDASNGAVIWKTSVSHGGGDFATPPWWPTAW